MRFPRTVPKRWWLLGVLVVLFLAALLAAKLIPSDHQHATASKNGGAQPLFLGDGNGGNIEIQQPVEQWTDFGYSGSTCCSFIQPWVTNPTGVAWDVDDHWEKIDSDGYLNGNATMTTTSQEVADTTQAYHCVINAPGQGDNCAWWSGGTGRDFQVFVAAPAATLIVSICYQPQARCFTVPASYDKPNRRYVYGICLNVKYRANDTAVGMIPGSGGDQFATGPVRGLGLVTTETVTVANPTGHTVRGIFAQVAVVGVGADGPVCSPALGHEDTFDYPFAWKIR